MTKFKKIYRYITASLCMLFLATLIQAQSFNWVKRVGGPSNENFTRMCADYSGNFYLAVAGGGPQLYFENDTLSVSGLNDMFIIKYNAIGNEIWKMKIGGPNTSVMPSFSEAITWMSFDSISNCIFVSGIYYQTCSIDTINLSASPSVSRGYLAKINMNGNVIWAKNFGSGFVSAPRFDTDKAGNLLMFFSISNTGTLDTIPVTAGGYIGKLDTDGTIVFIKRICGLSPQFPWSVYSYQKIKVVNDLVYVYGGSYDSLTLDTIFLPSSNYYSVVASVWDTSGSIQWARQSNNSESGIGTMCIDNNHNLYVMDKFDGPFITFNTDTIFTNGTYGSYLLKFNKFGNLIWHKSYLTGGVRAVGAVIDSEGNAYFTGWFLDSLIIDNFSLYSSTGIEELFIARFDSSGNCMGVRQAGSASGYDIAENSNGELYVAGTFRSTGTFGSISIPSYGSSDMFLANLSAITGSGGNERIANNQLIIYANPNKGSFRIKLPDALTDLTGALLTVYDVQGKEVARFNLEQTSVHPQLEINNAIAGLYTVRLVKGKQVFNGKLVVE
ncbi:MAG: T9SS type A sorting domain-containing protein [Bacteroidia bacterium]|nr:T9SS type A sorting domain-containing protein [Bacteroidia bacterium]MBP7244946.1 T9SS type A sorting domain-containing protein [Bacteroidia bacterium]